MAKKAKISGALNSQGNMAVLFSKLSGALQSGALVEAKKILDQARLESQFPSYWVSIFSSRIMVKEGDLEGAVLELKEALSKHEKNVDVVVELGLLHSKFGSGEEAFKLLSKAMEQDPDNYRVMGAFASACQRNRQLHEAIKYYRKSLFSILRGKKLKASSSGKAGFSKGFNSPENEGLLWSTLSQLAESGVHAFPSHGTLLGIVREGHLLDHDKDLDVGIPFSEMRKAAAVLQQHGWVKHKNNFGLFNPVAFIHGEKKVSLDLCGFVVEKGTGKTLYGFWMKGIPKSWNRILEVSDVDLTRSERGGCSIWFPKEPESLLESLYGSWRHPDPGYDALIGSNGLRDFSLLTECYAYSSIISAFGKEQYGKVKKKFEIILKHKPEDELALAWLKKLEKVA